MNLSRLFGLVLSVISVFAAAAGRPRDADWPMYGGDAARTRHSTLDQINRGNVASLEVAWRYDTGEKGTVSVRWPPGRSTRAISPMACESPSPGMCSKTEMLKIRSK